MNISVESIVAEAYSIGSHPEKYINVQESLNTLQQSLQSNFNIDANQAFLIVTNAFEDCHQQSYRHIQATLR